MFGVIQHRPKSHFFSVAAERRILTITSVGTLVMASSGVVHDCMIHGCHCHALGSTRQTHRTARSRRFQTTSSHATRSFPKCPSREINIHTVDYSLQNDLEELADAYEKELIREFGQKDWACFTVLFDPSYSVVSVTMATRPRSSRAMSSYWRATAGWRTLASRIRPSHLPVE
jgi:hypothetical protein